MKFRRLGRNGPEVSAISMGRGAQPVRFGDALEDEFNAAIARALDLGINLFDTSDAYWGAAAPANLRIDSSTNGIPTPAMISPIVSVLVLDAAL